MIRMRESEAPMTYEIHPAANLFPEMADEESRSLMVDIRDNGQREPIILFQGRVIDGRNRLRACRWLGVEPKTREYQGREEDIVTYVLSLNLHRRHLTESQRAMVAASIANMKPGNHSKAANLPVSSVAQAEAAKMLSVSERSVRTARTIIEKAEPEVVESIQTGSMSLNEASKVVHLKPDVQRVVAILPKAERRETLAGNTVEQLGVIGAREDEFGPNRQALCRIMAELAELKGSPEQLIGQMPKFLSPKLNKSFRQAFMKMQAFNAVYQNWELRNVHND